MSSGYLEVLRATGALKVFVPALVARLSFAMVTLKLLFGASMRVLWGSLTVPGALRTKAYSIDAVCEESQFTTGPLIAAAILSAASPTVGLLATATVALAGNPRHD